MKKIIPIFLSIVLISCDKELPAEVPPFQSEMVINSIIRPDTLISVVLSNSVSILSYHNPEPIEGATIKLFENDVFVGLLKDTVMYAEEGQQYYLPNAEPLDKLVGIYYTNYIPKENLSYRLEVNHPDYPPSLVTTQIPERTSLFEITLSDPAVESYSTTEEGEKVPVEIRYTPTIKIKDAPISNYYEVAVIGEYHERLYEYNQNGEVRSSRDVTYLKEVYYTSDDILFDEVDPPSILDDRNPYDGKNGTVFSDLLFNNQEYSLQINFFVPVGVIDVYDSDGGSEAFDTYKRFFIEIRSLSEEYYLYKNNLAIQGATGADPFAEPIQVFSNVEGGLGIFAGYNVELFEFSLEEFIPEE